MVPQTPRCGATAPPLRSAAGRAGKVVSVVLLYALVIGVAATIFLRRARDARGQRPAPRLRWFAAWSAAGSAFFFSLLSGFSIGLFVLPFAAVALLWVAGRAPDPRDAVGFFAGVGAVLLMVAFINRDYQPCPPDGRLWLPANSPPGASVSCGGVDPEPWLQAGLALTVSVCAVYVALRLVAGGRRPSAGAFTTSDTVG